jgi:prepilin-type N-terminal cleavage/methylation domain-containing protein
VFQRYQEIQSRRHNSDGNEVGFTLIELLIVIVVLGILAAIVIFSLTGVTGTSAVSACNADAKTVETAVQAYDAQTGGVPATVTVAADGTVTGDGDLVPSYLHTWPNAGSGANYSISYDSTVTTAAPAGTVNVTVNGNTTAYDNGNACKGA